MSRAPNPSTGFPVLYTERLRLDPITAADTEALFDHFSDPDVVRFYDLQAFQEPAQAGALIELFDQRYRAGLGIRWAIRHRDDDVLAGTVGFNAWNIAMHSAQVGYDVVKSFWGRGLATEALRAAIHCAHRGELKCGRINRIQADTVPGNLASERVLSKLGFIEEGLLRQSGFWEGRYHDLKCFGLVRDDWA